MLLKWSIDKVHSIRPKILERDYYYYYTYVHTHLYTAVYTVHMYIHICMYCIHMYIMMYCMYIIITIHTHIHIHVHVAKYKVKLFLAAINCLILVCQTYMYNICCRIVCQCTVSILLLLYYQLVSIRLGCQTQQ